MSISILARFISSIVSSAIELPTSI